MYKLIGTNSVKRLADGACIPFADGNKDYEEYKLWLEEGNTQEPEFTDEELVEQELKAKINEASQYLKDTDWYYARKAETGEEVPVGVVAKRIDARQFIKNNG